MYIALKRYYVSLSLLFVVAIISSTIVAYGHGLGADTSPSITISDRQVSIQTSLYPTFLEQVPNSKPTFLVRALDGDPSQNITLPGIDFRIVVELNDEILLDQRFRSSDGVVSANLIPDGDIQGWEVNGQANPATQLPVSQSTPVELRSRILTEGGLYHIVAIIESSSPGLMMQSDQKFDLYVSVGSSYTFDVQTAQGEEQMVAKSYYDEITNFDYSNKTIEFEMPFTWDRAY
ncbi:MAG TPA: hypothetical protein VHF28_02965, partial [Nitrososphaera sp.]|nr:hypothetical protein [Nitrososphaera sp.]